LNLREEDRWIISRINNATQSVTSAMDKYELGLAGQRIYETIWNEYCDWYIEIVKSRLYGDDEDDKKVAVSVLVAGLKDLIKMLHPFMPFITEEIWSYLPKTEGFLMKAQWPVYQQDLNFPEETATLEMAMAAIKAIRTIRLEADASPSKKLTAIILAETGSEAALRAGARYIQKLANITEITFIKDKNDLPEDVMSAVIEGAELFIPSDELLDYDLELARLRKEQEKLQQEVSRVKGKLENTGFVAKAPAKVIEEEKEKMAKYEDMLSKVTERLAAVEKKLG